MKTTLRNLIYIFACSFFAFRGEATPPRTPYLDHVEEIAKSLQVHDHKDPIGQLIQKIAQAYPALGHNYALVFASRSRQQASYKFPRAITYTDDAHFVLTFNGHPEHISFEEIEMMEFDTDSHRFHFLRIARRAASFKVFTRNEALCKTCHLQDPRPNWESYEQWPGVYQSKEDRVEGPRFAIEYGQEHDGFVEFYDESSLSGRYKILKDLAWNFAKTPPRRFPETNIELTQKLAWLNYLRIARIITSSPEYEKFKFAILGGVYACDNIESFLPQSILSGFQKRFAEIHFETERHLQESPNFFAWQNLTHVRRVASLRWLFEARGIDVSHWSMSFVNSRYSFATVKGTFDQFLSHALLERDPALEWFRLAQVSVDPNRRLLAIPNYTISVFDGFRETLKLYCTELKSLSLNAFRGK